MKKLLTMIGVAVLSAMMMAQGVTMHSVHDVNQNSGTNESEVANVAQSALQEASPRQTEQYVTAEELNEVLGNIYQLLGKLDQKLSYVLEKTEKPIVPDENGIYANGHKYVDLGVVVDGKPLYWATTNIGAKQPADGGLYFAWGETVGYTEDTNDGRKFYWSNYSSDLCGGSSKTIKKYCVNSNYGTVDNKKELEPEDDAAHVNWQGSWRMPTKAEYDALRAQCTWMWTTMSNSKGENVNGYKVSNKSDPSKFIFLPAAGRRNEDSFSNAGSNGYYWSSSLFQSNTAYAFYLYSGGQDASSSFVRCYGCSVRPVCW